MTNLLEVTERDITSLESHELRPLINNLLRAEARVYGIPALCLHLTDEDDTSDDGVDARINNTVDVSTECRIPSGLSVWQFKATSATPANITKESQKPGIPTAIKNDGNYCFVVGQSCTDTMRYAREQALYKAYVSLNKDPKYRLFTATDIAEWVTDYPVLARSLLRLQLPDDFYSYSQWKRLPQSGAEVEFQFNSSRQQIVDGIAEILNFTASVRCVRLVGADGTGKTRVVLEAIRKTGAIFNTFYVVTPEAIPEGFFNFIESRSSISKLVLVVDECSEETMRRLVDRAERCNGRVLLISIGSHYAKFSNGASTDVIQYFELDKLDSAMIDRIVSIVAPTLHGELQLYISRVVGGNVKLAVALAKSLQSTEGVKSVSELMRLPNVQFILNSLVKTLTSVMECAPFPYFHLLD